MLEDMASQLSRVRAELASCQAEALDATEAREAAVREAAAARRAQEERDASEDCAARLERALEELERERDDARAEAEAARKEVAHKDSMLTFVEREVRCPIVNRARLCA